MVAHIWSLYTKKPDGPLFWGPTSYQNRGHVWVLGMLQHMLQHLYHPSRNRHVPRFHMHGMIIGHLVIGPRSYAMDRWIVWPGFKPPWQLRWAAVSIEHHIIYIYIYIDR